MRLRPPATSALRRPWDIACLVSRWLRMPKLRPFGHAVNTYLSGIFAPSYLHFAAQVCPFGSAPVPGGGQTCASVRAHPTATTAPSGGSPGVQGHISGHGRAFSETFLLLCREQKPGPGAVGLPHVAMTEQTTTLHIKNMVCPRCIMAVRQCLADAGLQPLSVGLGTAVLAQSPPRRAGTAAHRA